VGGYNGADLATNEAYDPVGNAWRSLAPMPTARHGLAAARLGARIFAVGGLKAGVAIATLQVYNPTTNHWLTKAPMPTARGDLMAVAGSDGKLYAIGGWNSYNSFNDQIPLTTVEAYNPSTNTWATMAPMPTPRYKLAGAILNGKIYAIGGVAENTGDLTNLEAYDIASNTWSPLAPLPSSTDSCHPGLNVNGRAALAAAAQIGKIYAIGGTNEDYQALCSVLAYNPVTNIWNPAAPMPTARGLLAATRSGSRVYAIGGATTPSGIPSGPLSTVEAF
jgi:N-acetylneuraminic acid mutarotase